MLNKFWKRRQASTGERSDCKASVYLVFHFLFTAKKTISLMALPASRGEKSGEKREYLLHLHHILRQVCVWDGGDCFEMYTWMCECLKIFYTYMLSLSLLCAKKKEKKKNVREKLSQNPKIMNQRSASTEQRDDKGKSIRKKSHIWNSVMVPLRQ